MIKLSGQSIVETVIAAALISVAVIAALSLATRSERQSSYAKYSAQASKYTSQAGDWVRSERNRLGWATLVTKVETDSVDSLALYCLNDLPLPPNDFNDLVVGQCEEDTYIPETFFTRTITLDTTQAGSGILKISIVVSWQEKITRQTTLELELTQWN